MVQLSSVVWGSLLLVTAFSDPTHAVASGTKGCSSYAQQQQAQCAPVHCTMTPWSEWTPCMANSFKTRTRSVAIEPLNGGRACPQSFEMAKCCEDDCLVNEWGAWSSCNDATGNKTRVRTVARRSKPRGLACPSLSEQAKCDPVDCVLETKWTTWGNCSQNTKGEWVQTKTRNVKTEAKYGGKCPLATDATRFEQKKCAAVDCVLEAEWTAWGNCSQNAKGEWIQNKTRNVKTEAKYGGCCPSTTDPKRFQQKKCAAVNCVLETEWSAWGNCSQNSTGAWVQSKTRGVKTEAKYGGSCPLATDATRFEEKECDAVNCVLEAEWSAWVNCSQNSTGAWVQSKTRGVKAEAQYGGSCPLATDATRFEEKTCEGVACVLDDEWSGWSACSQNSTGAWVQSKTRGVKTEAQYGGSCPLATDVTRFEEKVCEGVACVLDDEWSSWGNCSQNSTGAWVQSKTRGVETEALYGGSCSLATDATRFEEKTCEAVACVLDTEWSSWGNCSQNSTGAWVQSKTRGVMTEAKFGGSCPPATDATRFEEKVCEGVACVLETEWTAWSDCQQNTTGAWIQSKTRGVKTEAQYGGSCPPATDATRLEVKSCAVDCVLEDQWSAWSDCTKNTTGVWAQTRTRGVKTQAKFGGLCPPATDPTRLASQECANNGFCKQKYASLYEACASTLAKCNAPQVGVDFSTGANIERWKGLTVWECCDQCTATLGCSAYTYRKSRDNDGSFDCFTKKDAGTTKLENLADTYVSSTVVNTECKVVDNVAYGRAVECTKVPGFDTSRVYRAMCGQIRWYPNPDVANSWDPNWFATRIGVNCTGIKIGREMPTKISL